MAMFGLISTVVGFVAVGGGTVWPQEPAAPASQPASQPTSQPASQPAVATLSTAFELYLEGYYERALEQYGSLAEDPEKRLEAVIGSARCHLMTGGYAAAMELLDTVSDQGGESTDWQATRSRLLGAVGRYPDAVAAARKAIELDPQNHRARADLGGLLEYVGQTEEAIETYAFFDRMVAKRLPVTAERLTAAAEGFYRYSVLTSHPSLSNRTRHVLQEMLQVAYERVDRNWWPARVAAAELLSTKYNMDDATEDYKAALRINNNLAVAHVGLGWIALSGWQFEEVDRRVDAALEVNPQYVEAFVLRARSRVQERRYDEALAACAEALRVNPNNIEALASAACAHRAKYESEKSQEYISRAEAVNPKPAYVYNALGDTLSGLRQYADSEAAYLRCIEYDPVNANARTELGLMYMQWGQEDKARPALDAAWELDSFNARTYNTLDLLEKLEKMSRTETEHFLILYDKNLDWPVAPYLADTLEQIYGDITLDYDAELDQRTIIEVMPTHRDFGVRITGKPWIYTVGACTGWVIAIDSPRSHPQTRGPFHMGNVLRHEFVHTVTLAMTHNRIEHWLTEGLAVYSEDSPRSYAWCELLADAVRRNKLFTLESINWGFIRPKEANDRQRAYAQAEWMVEYIVLQFGYDKLLEMIRAFAEAKPAAQVFREVLETEAAAFDAQFAEWARKEAAGWGFDLSEPENLLELRALGLIKTKDASVQGRLAKAEYDAGNLELATDAAKAALNVEENELLALTVQMSVLAIARQKARRPADRNAITDELKSTAERLAVADADDWSAAAVLAELALEGEDFDEAEEWLERLKRLNPLHPLSYRGLGGIYLARGERDKALPELLELVRTDEHDASVRTRIASIFAANDRLGEAKYWYLQSMLIDPYDPASHRKLAEVCMRMNDTETALAEYDMLCRLQPDQAVNFSDAAFAHKKAGNAEKAAEFAEQSVKLDPNSPAKTLLGASPEPK